MVKTIPMSSPSSQKSCIDLALIDGDILMYEIGSVCYDHPLGPEYGKVPAPESAIKKLVDDRIEGILERVDAKEYRIFITGKGNFRFKIATVQPYKGNRDGVEKPAHHKTVKDYLLTRWNAEVVTGTEADDALGLLQRYYLPKDTVTAIASRDKDLRMVEGWHYSWACGENQAEKPLYEVSYLEGMRFFFKQLLTGDSTDNILGCAVKEHGVYKSGKKEGEPYIRRKGVGPAGADKVLNQGDCPQQWFTLVREAYEGIYGEDCDRVMLENARLLYIGQKSKDNQFEWSWINVTTNTLQEEQKWIIPTVVCSSYRYGVFSNPR